MKPEETVCRQLADYVTSLDVDRLPQPVREWATVLILDNLACVVGGAQCDAGRVVLSALEDMGVLGAGAVTLPGGRGRRTAAPWAAFAGSSLANALDYDDTLYGHPGSAIIPVALAVAESVGASGREFLSSIIAGYEVASRLCAASAPTAAQRKRVWGIAGRLAPVAAAVTARLLKLSPAVAAEAIACAAASAPVSSINKTLYSDLGPTMAKNNYGAAVLAGITGAWLAAAGHTSPLDVFEGETGWWRMLGSDHWNANLAVADLGTTHEILRVELKPYPCCRFIHSAIGAAIDLYAAHRIQADEIRRVQVKTFSWTSVGAFAQRNPQTMQDAQFSIPYCVAVTLLGHAPGPAWFDRALMASPEVARLAALVDLVPCPEFDDRHLTEWLAEVTIETGRGDFTRLVRFPLGHPKNPMTPEAAAAKFDTLAGGAIGASNAESLRIAVVQVEQAADVRCIAELIGGGTDLSMH